VTIERRSGVVSLALVASFMVFVDGTIVNLALAQLTSHLDASRPELEWTVNAYTLTFAAVMLGAGSITDVLGARCTFITGLWVFTAASGGCALAGSMPVLIAARLAQGVGAALLLPSALVLATATAADASARHRLVGWWAAAGGAGMAAGPLLGGALVAVANWRAVFAVNVVIGVPAVLWSLRSMPAVARRERRLDLAGMTMATLLIGGAVFAFVEAPARGWTDPAVLAAGALAGTGAVGFTLAERHAAAPVLPVMLYAHRGFVTALAQGALFNFTFYGLLFALGLLLQVGRGMSALTSGLLFLPLTGLISVGSLCAAWLGRRLGRRVLLALGQGVITLSLLAVAWAAGGTQLWPLALALAPAGLCAGMLVPSMTAQALAGVDTALHGAASAVFNTARQLGGAVGVAVFGPLLGTAHALSHGFRVVVVVGAAATALALGLNRLEPSRAQCRAPSVHAA